MRQAFDKPVALVQEVGTPQIFDISPLRYTEYRKERIYHEVLEDQKAVAVAIEETFKSHGTGRGINSIVKLLALSKPATLPEISSPEAKADLQQIILAELGQLRDEVRLIRYDTQKAKLSVRNVSQRDLTSEVAYIRKMIDHLELVMATNDEASLEQAELQFGECRIRLLRLMERSREEPTLKRDLEMLREMDRRLDLLEMSLYKRRLAESKQK